MMVYTIGVIGALLLFVAIGNYAGSRVKNADDYYVSGRQAPTLLIVGTLVASYVSTNALMAESSFMYGGYPAPMLILAAVNACGYILGAFFFGRFVRRSEAKTVPEFFGRRFSPKVQKAAAVTILIGVFAYLFSVMQGSSVILHQLLGIDRGWCLLLIWLTFSSFTIFGGSKGVLLSDTVMCFVFLFCVFAAIPFLLHAAGGWETMVTQLNHLPDKPDLLSYHGLTGETASWKSPAETLGWALIYGIVWGIVVATSPWQSSRYLMAKNEHVVMRSGFISAITVLFFYIGLALVAMGLLAIAPDLPDEQQLLLMALGKGPVKVFPTLLGVLIVSGILSAAISSASTFLSLIGFSLVNDLGFGMKKHGTHMLAVSRVSMLIVGLLALLTCYIFSPGIMWATYFAATIFASSWGPVSILSIWWKKITTNAAFYSIIIGFSANIVAKIGDVIGWWRLPTFADPFVIGFVSALFTAVLLSLFGTVSEEEKAIRQKILTAVPPAEYHQATAIKITFTTGVATIIMATLIIIFLLCFYARPYLSAIT
jgi:Na+/proline symporter